MTEYRLLQAQEDFNQAIKLADKVFRKEGHTSMGTAFPQVFSTALQQSYGAFIDGKLVSFIGLVPSVLHIEGAEVKAFSIGAVCTEPDFRRKGLANTLLQMVFDHINNSGATLLFISGDLPLYLKQGCTFYGKLNKYVIGQGDLPKLEHGYSVRELGPFDWFEIRKLSQARSVLYEQSIFEFAQLNEAAGFASIFKMNHKILVAEENHELKAFLVFGMPTHPTETIDSRVIEWGGDPKAIRVLLSESFNYGLNSLVVNLPNYESELKNQLETLNHVEEPFPGTIKIMNLDLLLHQVASYLKGKIKIEKLDEDLYQLVINQNIAKVSRKELETLILKGSDESDSEMAKIFPIPLPFPQGLNYV